MEKFSRTSMLIGKEAMEKLKNAHIAVFGVGGVGGYVVEALVRSGIENFDIIDNDVVSISNLNRQLMTYQNNIGNYKTDEIEKTIEIEKDC